MKKRFGPYAFVFFLLLIIVFIAGTRYGRRVGEANKTIDYILSIPPSKAVLTPTPPTYLTYNNKLCGVKLLYPSYLVLTEESSRSAQLTKNSSSELEITCDKSSDLATALSNPKIATYEITFKNRKITGKKDNKLIIFPLMHPSKAAQLYFGVDQGLLPLLESTLQMTP